jgi:hypothetical protein
MGELRTISPYDPQKVGAQLGNAVRNHAPAEQVAVLEARLRIGQIETKIRKVMDGAEPLDEEAASYLINVIVRLSVRGRLGGGRGGRDPGPPGPDQVSRD